MHIKGFIFYLHVNLILDYYFNDDKLMETACCKVCLEIILYQMYIFYAQANRSPQINYACTIIFSDVDIIPDNLKT